MKLILFPLDTFLNGNAKSNKGHNRQSREGTSFFGKCPCSGNISFKATMYALRLKYFLQMPMNLNDILKFISFIDTAVRIQAFSDKKLKCLIIVQVYDIYTAYYCYSILEVRMEIKKVNGFFNCTRNETDSK